MARISQRGGRLEVRIRKAMLSLHTRYRNRNHWRVAVQRRIRILESKARRRTWMITRWKLKRIR
jgi:hypothetical protein